MKDAKRKAHSAERRKHGVPLIYFTVIPAKAGIQTYPVDSMVRTSFSQSPLKSFKRLALCARPLVFPNPRSFTPWPAP
jgi:hypothetical protein